MYHKAKNTLASLAIAVTMLGVSYSVGRPPVQVVEAAGASVETGQLIADRPGMGSDTTTGFSVTLPVFVTK